MIRTTSGIPATVDTIPNPHGGEWPWIAIAHRHDNTPAPTAMIFYGSTNDEAQRNALLWLGATTYQEETTP